jgi:hypothetical protein
VYPKIDLFDHVWRRGSLASLEAAGEPMMNKNVNIEFPRE